MLPGKRIVLAEIEDPDRTGRMGGSETAEEEGEEAEEFQGLEG